MTDVPNLVRERLKAAQAGTHPDPNLLTAFAEQALSERERIPVLDHLARCTECREVVALQLPPTPSPALVSGKDTRPVQKAPWFRWSALRWGALAACVVIVSSAVLMQRTTMNRVAMTAGPVKESAETVPLRQMAPLTDDTLNQQAAESKQDKSRAKKGILFQDKKEADEQFMYSTNKVAAPAVVLNERTANVPEAKRPIRADAAPPAQPVPAPTSAPAAPPPIPQAEARSLPVGDRDGAGVAAMSPSKVATETVAVNATAPPATTGQKSLVKGEAVGKAKTANSQFTTVGGLAAPVANEDTAEGEKSAKLHSGYFRFAAELSRWTISSDGQLQHSIDSGKTWQPMTVADRATFRALSANGPDVWVGGSAGLLYHSADAGGHWTQVKPTANGVPLIADIAAIEFTDPQRGKVTTTTGEAWRTADAGQTWQKQP